MQKVSYTGNGSTTEFTFNFPFYENTNIVVTKNGTTATTGYTVIGTSAGLNADIPYTGGKVVFDTAPIATDSITISRQIPLTRYTDYQPTELINPTVLNQDQNYTLEIIKDFRDELDEFDEKYDELTDLESLQTLETKIDTVSTQITNLGDISTLRQNVTDLTTTTGNHTTTIASHTNSIGTLDTRTTGIIDYVVESQNPTADNNYTWYRKYKSGWVEQGGTAQIPQNEAGVISSVTVNLPITLSNGNYHADYTRIGDPGNAYSYMMYINARTTTTIDLCSFSTVATSGPQYVCWKINGISAQ